MVTITLNTWINAPADVVFDLSRSIDFHTYSVADTKEKAVDGIVTGLIGNGQTVTWRAKHFGIYQTPQVQISKMQRPQFFTDMMIRGPFKSMRHQHLFEPQQGGTLMRDIFEFEAPLGFLGRLAELLFLKRYLRNLLKIRNRALKQVAESNQVARFFAHNKSTH